MGALLVPLDDGGAHCHRVLSRVAGDSQDTARAISDVETVELSVVHGDVVVCHRIAHGRVRRCNAQRTHDRTSTADVGRTAAGPAGQSDSASAAWSASSRAAICAQPAAAQSTLAKVHSLAYTASRGMAGHEPDLSGMACARRL